MEYQGPVNQEFPDELGWLAWNQLNLLNIYVGGICFLRAGHEAQMERTGAARLQGVGKEIRPAPMMDAGRCYFPADRRSDVGRYD
jgi:hypothetical protein